MQHEILVPGVELLESMRSVGYSFHSAIADLIDNSITAGAKSIQIIGDPVAAGFVTILDDGAGMDPTTARSALQLAGSTQNGARSNDDLGRFGLGLKTASLSQARRLTVLTKRDDTVTALQWDIDLVRETGLWSLNVLDESDYVTLPNAQLLLSRSHGTLVVWQELDYMLGAALKPEHVMAERLESLRSHLALTFHRFLDDGTRNPLSIHVNGVPIVPVDPFLASNPKTQVSFREPLSIDRQRVEFQAFTLPHSSALTAAERKRWDLGPGMRERQGFYIYRNKRLISFGHWYGLARREELSKQSRVMVDIPNTLDHLWQLDIKKSRAEPPQSFRIHFKRVMEQVIGKSKRVHTFRGRRDSDDPISRMWNKVTDRDGYRYEVNSEHPLISALSEELGANGQTQLRQLLRDLAATFPTDDLYVEATKNSKASTATTSTAEVREQLQRLHKSALFGSQSAAQIATLLRASEPFDRVDDLQKHISDIWNEGK